MTSIARWIVARLLPPDAATRCSRIWTRNTRRPFGPRVRRWRRDGGTGVNSPAPSVRRWPCGGADAVRTAEHRSVWPFSGGRMTDPRFRVRQTIVFVQIAIATTLLAGAALLIASFHRLMAVPPGFNTDRTLLADVSLPVSRYSRDTRGPFYARLLDRVRSVHGVEAAGAGGPLPLSGLDGLLRFGPMTMEGRLPTPDRLQRAYVRWATPEYFRAMGIGFGPAGSSPSRTPPHPPRSRSSTPISRGVTSAQIRRLAAESRCRSSRRRGARSSVW